MNVDLLHDLKKQNRENNINEYEMGHLVLSSWPRVVFVELTQNCNLHCGMCRKKQRFDPAKNMSFELFKRIADQVFPRAEIVDLRGFGESTILKDLHVFIEYANKFKVNFRLFTNLTVHSEKLWDMLARYRFMLAISFDGASKDIFEKIRTGAQFDSVIKNLKLLTRKYLEYGYDPGEYVYFSTTVQKDNLLEIIGIMSIMKEYGIKTIKLFPIGCAENDDRNLIHYEDDVKKLLLGASQYAIAHGISLELGESLHPSLTRIEAVIDKCIHPWTFVVFDYNGNIGYCDNLIGITSNQMGSILDSNFMDVWNNSNYIKLRQKHRLISLPKFDERFSACNLCYLRRYNEAEHLSYPAHSCKIVGTKLVHDTINLV